MTTRAPQSATCSYVYHATIPLYSACKLSMTRSSAQVSKRPRQPSRQTPTLSIDFPSPSPSSKKPSACFPSPPPHAKVSLATIYPTKAATTQPKAAQSGHLTRPCTTSRSTGPMWTNSYQNAGSSQKAIRSAPSKGHGDRLSGALAIALGKNLHCWN